MRVTDEELKIFRRFLENDVPIEDFTNDRELDNIAADLQDARAERAAMPQYDWAKMTPRERDVLVWTKVFGCSEPEWRDGEPYYSDLASVTISNYSTDMSAAWEAVEKMKYDYFFEIRVGPIASARFTKYGEHGISKFFGHCMTAPEAICIAALRAKGVDV